MKWSIVINMMNDLDLYPHLYFDHIYPKGGKNKNSFSFRQKKTMCDTFEKT